MSKEKIINSVIDDVLSCTRNPDRAKVRELIILFWGLKEKKYNKYMCLTLEDYEYMIEEIMAG